MRKIHALIVDPQIDFCDPDGALYVKGAENDMDRLAQFISREGKRITHIHVTLDCHHLLDVAHPLFWRNSQGEHPNPSTIISYDDVKNSVWVPIVTGLTKKMLHYVKRLSDGGRYSLIIQHPHCLIGSHGHSVVLPILEALLEWETRPAIVNYITKGSNIFTEHYSGIKAEVPDPYDPATQLNACLMDTLQNADMVIIAGEAGSHSLKNTVQDIADNFTNDKDICKIVLLKDATSPVVGFEDVQDGFIADMIKRGMQVATTADLNL